jgi:hypothetical protein
MSSRFTAVESLKTRAARTDEDFKPANNPQYAPFPDLLRKQVNEPYVRVAVASGFNQLVPAADDLHQHFALKMATIPKFPAGDPDIKTIGVYEKAEAANAALLNELCKEQNFALPDRRAWVQKRNLFDHFENPALLEIFMPHVDEVGFGFDAG